MQTPHTPIAQSGKSPQQRFATIALVGALHIAAIYVLIHALAPSLLPPVPPPDIKVDFFPTKPPTLPPQPPVSSVVVRLPGVAPVKPVITIEEPQAQGSAVVGPTIPPGGQNAVNNNPPILTPVRAIASTHSIPAYPLLAVRLNEQGNVQLSLTIDEQGYVTDAVVLTSSGYDALDAAALAWVKAHWRYQPATRDGQAVPGRTDAIVTFRLTNRRG